MKRAFSNVLSIIFAITLLILYTILAGLAGRWWNNIFNGGNFAGAVTMLMMFLFVTTILSIASNIAWALGMLLSPRHSFKSLAALSAITGLILLSVFSKYHRAASNTLGNEKLLLAYEAFAIINGIVSTILGVIYLMAPEAHVVETTDKYAAGQGRPASSSV